MDRLPAVQVADGDRVDLNRRVRQRVDSENRSSWGSLREVLGKHSIHDRVRLHVRQIYLGVDNVLESQPRRLQDGLDVVEGLSELRVWFAWHGAVWAAGSLARDVEIVAGIHACAHSFLRGKRRSQQ